MAGAQVATYRVWREAGASYAAASVQAHFRLPPSVPNKAVRVVLAILSPPVLGIGLIYVNVRIWVVHLGMLITLFAGTAAPALDSRSTLLSWSGADATFAGLAFWLTGPVDRAWGFTWRANEDD